MDGVKTQGLGDVKTGEKWAVEKGQSIKGDFSSLIKLHATPAPLQYKDCTYDC